MPTGTKQGWYSTPAIVAAIIWEVYILSMAVETMALLIWLLGPTLLVFSGLQLMKSVPITFLLFYSWLLLIPLADLLFRKRGRLGDSLIELGFVSNRINECRGVYSGLLFSIAIVLCGFLFHDVLFTQNELEALLVKWDFSGDKLIWLILVLLLINPVLEEWYWRGFLYQKLAGRLGVKTTLLVTSAGYSLYHLCSVLPLFNWPFNVLVIVPVFVAGLFWGYIRAVDRSLVGSIISHVLADTGIMMVYLLFLR